MVCLTELRLGPRVKHNFTQLLIKTKLLKSKEFFSFNAFKCCINHASECLNANNCWHFNIYEHDTFHTFLVDGVKLF